MGGFMRFGPIEPEVNEPVFHREWERRAFALNVAMRPAGGWNLDQKRHADESSPALAYWGSSYYERWLMGMERLMLASGVATAEEIATGRPLTPSPPPKRVLTPDRVTRGGAFDRPADRPAKFSAGDKVRCRIASPAGHTRLPRYAMGRMGQIVAIHGAHVFPDSNAHGLGEDPHWLYTVRFTALELWGKDSPDSISIDLWEPYLDAV
jgi:nitrile hydratase